MKGPSPFRADQYAPLLCLWGIKSLKRKGGFCIKIQTMVHKTFFFSLSCFMLYTFSLALFTAFAFNFPLLWGGGGGVGGVGPFNEAGNFDYSASRCLQEANNQSSRRLSLSRMVEYVAPLAHMFTFTYRFSNIVYSKQMSPLRQTCIVCRDKQTYGFSVIA